MSQETSQISILILLKDPEVKNHFIKLFKRLRCKFIVCKDSFCLLNHLEGKDRAIVFIESSIFKTEDMDNLYSVIFKKCPLSKIVLVCKQEDRTLIKSTIEKGGYASIVEPYDAWEITTILKHLMADLKT